MTGITKKITQIIKSWWVFLISGILLIGLSIWIFMTPLESFLGMTVVFSIFVLVNGISNIYFSVSNRKELEGWGWYLANGIFEVIIGAIFILYPGLSVITLPFIVGFWLLFKAVFLMGTSFELRRFGFLDWGLLLSFGAALGLFSFFIIIEPLVGIFTVVGWTGLALLLFGAGNIVLAYKLKKQKRMTLNKADELNARIKQEVERFRQNILIDLETVGEEGRKVIAALENNIEDLMKNLEKEEATQK